MYRNIPSILLPLPLDLSALAAITLTSIDAIYKPDSLCATTPDKSFATCNFSTNNFTK